MRHAWLATDVVQHRAHFGVHVRHLVQHLAEPREIIGLPAHVRRDERGLRVLSEQVVALRNQRLEAGIAILRIAALGEQRLLQPSLVCVVQRTEELLRIAGVDEHRELQSRAGVPDGVQLGIVELEARTIRLANGQPKALRDLANAHRAIGHVRLQLRHGLLGPRRPHVLEADAGKDAHPVLHLFGATHAGHRVLQPVARHVVCRHHHPHVQAVERCAEARESLARAQQSLRMAVEIDGGILRRLHHVHRRHQR